MAKFFNIDPATVLDLSVDELAIYEKQVLRIFENFENAQKAAKNG